MFHSNSIASQAQLDARPLVLLSNDDGFRSPGLQALRTAFEFAGAEVVVVAPETEQSASSHALSLWRPLRLREVSSGLYAVDGTPADCVYVAIHGGTRVLNRKPNLVVSGINHGLNLGQDVFYSGTVAAAREAALRGVPSIAVSSHPAGDLSRAASETAAIAFNLMKLTPDVGTLININFPKVWNGEFRAARLGERIYEQLVEFRNDPRGREYLWIGGAGVEHVHNPGSDTQAYDDGAASIVPLVLDLTHVGQHALAEKLAATSSKPL